MTTQIDQLRELRTKVVEMEEIAGAQSGNVTLSPDSRNIWLGQLFAYVLVRGWLDSALAIMEEKEKMATPEASVQG